MRMKTLLILTQPLTSVPTGVYPRYLANIIFTTCFYQSINKILLPINDFGNIDLLYYDH